MTILVKIFGDLRYNIDGYKINGMLPLNLNIKAENVKNVSDILDFLLIEKEKTGHIFVNAVYAGFNKKVFDGDRVGIFPKSNMSLLYKWYFKRKED